MKKLTFLILLKRSKIPILLLLLVMVLSSLLMAEYHWHISIAKLKQKIVVDPGHGGIDGGANDGGEVLEKDINLKIATYLKKELEKQGNRIILTRESDEQLDHLNKDSSSRHIRDLLARVDIINSNKADLFVSIHVNANIRKPQTDGPMIFYNKNSEESKALGSFVLNRLNDYTSKYGNQGEKEPIGTTKFLILKHAEIPGILVEVGFLTNTVEKDLLIKDEYQKGLAHGIFLGINDYFNRKTSENKPKTT